VGHAETSGDLQRLITEGKKIIITTVQKFPSILDAMAGEHLDRNFAIVIDEAHSSQGGRTSAVMNMALGDLPEEDEDTFEDQVNKLIEGRKMLANASYFAFTATPKNKTLELFGDPSPQPDGTVKHLPFHNYTMKQAIQEGFILDVLGNYTSIRSYFNLVKMIDDDPEFDSRRAQRRLRHHVEGHEYAVRAKAEIMVDHFNESVFSPRLMGGKARAMVVTDGVNRAIDYYLAISDYVSEKELPFRAIVAFSGERDHNGARVSEAFLNGFPSRQIPGKVREDPYRILICADKFQTGYDEPLLNTMYVDKTLGGIKAVQTLSRLNRAAPNKDGVFVLDFMNDPDAIQASFEDYYQTTILADETDPDKLHDLRGALDPTLDLCVEEYLKLDEAGQVEFKSSAKAFTRLYAFLSQVLPYGNARWEKLSIFLNFLIPKLPAPEEPDLSRGILEAVDMDSYRTERQAARSISLAEEDAEINPVLAAAGGQARKPEMDRLSNIIAEFNRLWGGEFTEPERVTEIINRMPSQVSEDDAYRNARLNSDRQNAQIEHDSAVRRLITAMVRCQTELYKTYNGNEEFRDWLNREMFRATYQAQETD
jgi:type I restriction enzyme R subunit